MAITLQQRFRLMDDRDALLDTFSKMARQDVSNFTMQGQKDWCAGLRDLIRAIQQTQEVLNGAAAMMPIGDPSVPQVSPLEDDPSPEMINWEKNR